MWTGFKRIVRSGFIGFWRNAYVSLAAIFVMTVALFVIGATLLLDQMLTVSLQQIQDKVDINVYFVTDAPLDEIESLQSSLQSLPDVEDVTLTTREQALEQFRQRYSDDELTILALEELNENPLGASLSIRAKETTQYQGIAQFLAEREDADPQNQIIDRVNYLKNKEAIDKLTNIINAVERSSFIAMIVLVVAAVLITFNTIRLAIYTTREEIAIMRLVGASNTYIRGPFVLQGVMYGLIAGLLALLIIYPVVLWLGPATEEFFEFNLFDYFVRDFEYLFAVVVGTGVGLGVLSSLFAVARYLRV